MKSKLDSSCNEFGIILGQSKPLSLALGASGTTVPKETQVVCARTWCNHLLIWSLCQM